MLLILLIIAALVFSIWFSIEMCDTTLGKIGLSIGMSCLTGFLAILISFLSGCAISAFCDVEYVEDSTYEIVALKDNSTISGHTHFLGSGHFNGKMQYVYLMENENGNLKMKTVEAKFVEVAISDEVAPHVIVKRAKFTNGFMNFLLASDASAWYPDHYIICVPEGTIDYSYNIDLE
jgi:hypothetical protein